MWSPKVCENSPKVDEAKIKDWENHVKRTFELIELTE